VTTGTAAVVGQLARDLVLSVAELPGPGAAADAADRREQLGGKGANQAVALAQLGVRPRLIAAAGDDVIGDVLLDQARADGIDVSTVVRRRGTLTGLIVEVLDARAEYRYVQDLPLLTVADVRGATRALATADAVLDAFVAALTDALLRGLHYVDAACWAVAAAGATVGHAGGRPHLSEAGLRERAAGLRRQL
jgi:ribokinase